MRQKRLAVQSKRAREIGMAEVAAVIAGLIAVGLALLG
jgi:hypothetical protein